MNTIVKQNENGQIIYTKMFDGTETWYEDGLCVKLKYSDGYEVKYTYGINTQTIIRVEDNQGFSEDFLANTLYSQ